MPFIERVRRSGEAERTMPVSLQKLLALRIGLTRQTVNAIEQGKYSPTLEAAFRIARVFGRPLEEVFRYDGD